MYLFAVYFVYVYSRFPGPKALNGKRQTSYRIYYIKNYYRHMINYDLNNAV